jgi:hypothetical protein
MQAFRQALKSAFNEPEMELLITDYFIPESFLGISPPGFGKTAEYRIHEVLNYARMHGWLFDLVAAARERRPKDAAIARIAQDLGLTVAGPRVNNSTGVPFEALVMANAKFINPATLRERLAELEAQVCWIDIPGGNGGTGFLVSPTLVLTNHHVIIPIKQNAVSRQDVKCRFDYREPIDGSTLTMKKTTEVKLDPVNWLLDDRPPSDFDWDPTLGEAAPADADYALIRLAEPIGDLPVGGPNLDPKAQQPRSWIDTTGEPPALAAGNQVFVIQHPLGEPQQMTVGTVKQFNNAGTRVRYDANSKKGSSGAPCLDADMRLVALHHAHDPAVPPAWNQAIPLATLQKVWKDRNVVVS